MLSFSIFSDVGSICCLLWTMFYILLVFYLTLLLDVALFKVVYTLILQYFLCCFYVQLLTLNDSMPFYCFNHYFNDISMVTLFKEYFYCIFSSAFIIVLLVDFTLRMASSK